MAESYTCAAPLPVELATGEPDQPPRSRIPVAELGTFSDPRYGRFAITQAKVANWQKLLAAHFHGRVPVDFDHNTDKSGPTGSKAAAWIVGLDQNGPDGETPNQTMVWATVEWTPPGAEAVRNREYLYISPTFVDQLADKRGNKLGPALLRAALTNSPFLHDMPAVSLSGQFATREPAPGENAGGADSRPAMADLTAFASALGLDADADEATILAAATDAKAKADAKPAPTTGDAKTLEAQAASEGKVLMSADQVAELTANAAKGVEAAETLRTQTFEAAFATALSEGRVDAKEETKTLHRGLYDAKPDLALDNLAALPKIVNLDGHGGTGTTLQTDGTTEVDGLPVDSDSAARLAKAEAYATEHQVDLRAAIRTLEAQGAF